MVIGRCEECNTQFTPNRYWQRFCSPACRTKQAIRTQKEYVALGRKVKEQMSAAHTNSPDLFEAA